VTNAGIPGFHHSLVLVAAFDQVPSFASGSYKKSQKLICRINQVQKIKGI
jgi:hypothetical protein